MQFISTAVHYILYYSFVNPWVHPKLYSLQESGRWFFICMALFLPLALLSPGKPKQPKIRKDMVADSLYWFFSPFLYTPIRIFMVGYLVAGLYAVNDRWLNPQGESTIAHWPVWVQVILMLLSADILQYWTHRLFHQWPLWKFHAIHHSPEHVDWMTSARFHPVNIIIYSTFMNALVFLLGFSRESYDALFLFNAIYSPLVHANLNWTYGPFKYVLASPVFHRWHHTHYNEGGNKNFAPTFPFLDVLFGTFYMPKGEQPHNFGTPNDPVPLDIVGQLFYPFKSTPPRLNQPQEESHTPVAVTPLPEAGK